MYYDHPTHGQGFANCHTSLLGQQLNTDVAIYYIYIYIYSFLVHFVSGFSKASGCHKQISFFCTVNYADLRIY